MEESCEWFEWAPGLSAKRIEFEGDAGRDHEEPDSRLRTNFRM